ncbi:MAG TPA: M20/M25/M40 family metallo-hydrolase, partial [Alphaproteobacteria bacterium]|nr:M20/M25/M40 family metallo-hydrolase [Alphaproteobacteria bacterium]
VPAAVRLSGTIRSLRPEVRKGLAEGLRRIAETVPAAFGATGRFDFHPGYPATVNSAAEAELAARVAAEVVGPANVGEAKPSMGAEDFAYMLNARPGAYLFLGQAGAAGGCMVHNPGYDFNDAILPVGASFWARLVETALPAPPR